MQRDACLPVSEAWLLSASQVQSKLQGLGVRDGGRESRQEVSDASTFDSTKIISNMLAPVSVSET